MNNIEYDPVENTQEYKDAMIKIQPILDEEFPKDAPPIMGSCHSFWYRKKELLLEKGIEWKTPAEMNPFIIFD